MDLGTWANWAEVIGGLAVVAGLGFGLLEFRKARFQRAEAAALEIVRAGQSPEFMEAIARFYDAPEITDQILAKSPDLRDSVHTLWAIYETLGYLVYRRVIPLDILDEFAGGALRLGWEKCRGWVEGQRERPGAQNSWEWIEWLYIQVTRHPSPGKDVGAHKSRLDWSP